MKIQATVGILTFNSGQTLRRALESVKDFDDIVICDGGSRDDTLAIAQEFGARVIAQDPKFKNADGTLKDYGGVRNQCLNTARHDWFLYIDSDETASADLCEEIRIATKKQEPLVYRVPIGIMMDGRYIKYSSNYPGYQTRFFSRRSGAKFVRTVHERIEYKPQATGTFRHPWLVHTTRGYWLNYIEETAGYRPLEVRRSCEAPLMHFVRYGVLHGLRVSLGVVVRASFLYGLHGFKDTLPWQGEFGRAMAPLVLIWQAVRCRASR